MGNKKKRWSKVYESSEEELVEFLRSRNITAQRIASEESGATLQQTSKTELTVWCAEGSLSVRQDDIATSLQPGDSLHLHAGKPYELIGGLTGYVCYVS